MPALMGMRAPPRPGITLPPHDPGTGEEIEKREVAQSPRSLEMPGKGGKVQLAGGGAPPFLRSAHLECPSSVILVTAPALTGAGAIAADRQSEARSVMG